MIVFPHHQNSYPSKLSIRLNSKTAYQHSLNSFEQENIFAQSWWLDATAGEKNWTAFFAENKFSFAAHQKNKLLQKALLPSVLTPYQPVVKFDATLVNELNHFSFVELFWRNFEKKWLMEFEKNDWKISFKHTRQLELDDIEKLYNNFKPSLKRQIQKAENALKVSVNEDLQTLHAVSSETFTRQKKQIPCTFEQLKTVDEACKKHHARKYFIAYNTDAKPCAAIYLVYDKNCCYYILGGISIEFKNSGAMCLLLWQAIQFAKTEIKHFDFCGSTITSIDKFFSTFGAQKIEVLVLNKYANSLQEWAIRKWKK